MDWNLVSHVDHRWFRLRDFWSLLNVSKENGAPYQYHDWLSHKRFECILQALAFHKKDPPAYRDKFWEVRDMLEAWNDHMSDVFKPGWATCLDERMSIWNSQWTCLGWVFVPRKPHPFGNEYHTISCGLSGIMFGLELVEGKDRPREIPRDPNEGTYGATSALLLRLCKQFFSTGKIVVLDSGFCVLQGLIELRKRGGFGHAVIKKRRYWPKYIKGDKINEAFANKDVGYTDVMVGKLDGVKYYVFCLRDVGFTMKVMLTYGDLTVSKKCEHTRRFFRDASGETLKCDFKYTQVFENHFTYCHSIDDHNHLRHQVPALE